MGIQSLSTLMGITFTVPVCYTLWLFKGCTFWLYCQKRSPSFSCFLWHCSSCPSCFWSICYPVQICGVCCLHLLCFHQPGQAHRNHIINEWQEGRSGQSDHMWANNFLVHICKDQCSLVLSASRRSCMKHLPSHHLVRLNLSAQMTSAVCLLGLAQIEASASIFQQSDGDMLLTKWSLKRNTKPNLLSVTKLGSRNNGLDGVHLLHRHKYIWLHLGNEAH